LTQPSHKRNGTHIDTWVCFEAAAQRAFTPTKTDRLILRALAKAGFTLGQDEIEDRSGVSENTLKERLPILEDNKLVDRPNGPKAGYALTKRGIDADALPMPSTSFLIRLHPQTTP